VSRISNPGVPRSSVVPHPHHRRMSRAPRTRSMLLVAAALVLTGALPAVAQDTDPLAKLDPNCRYQIESIIDSAESVGIPTRPILLKSIEGIQKHADCRQIVTVVRRKFGYLKTAHAAIGPVDGNELDAAASVIEAGAKPEQIAEFRVRQKGRSDLTAFAIWADFIGRGVPRDEAFTAISKLWRDGADDETFQGLWNNVSADILKGLNPGAALQNRIREGPARGPSGTVKPPENPQENQSSE
jgi:hypothetical protein